jgi:hypothetical protein
VNISDIDLVTLYREWCQTNYSEAYLNGRPFMPPNPARMNVFAAWFGGAPTVSSHPG